jgi:hypothetical protein
LLVSVTVTPVAAIIDGLCFLRRVVVAGFVATTYITCISSFSARLYYGRVHQHSSWSAALGDALQPSQVELLFVLQIQQKRAAVCRSRPSKNTLLFADLAKTLQLLDLEFVVQGRNQGH